jgi:hypothetical protein
LELFSSILIISILPYTAKKNIYAKSTVNHNPLPQEIEYLTLLKGENFRRTESICYTNKIYINTGEHNISRFLIKNYGSLNLPEMVRKKRD